MNIGSNNIEMVQTVAKGLEKFLDELVFVGGAVTSLYIEDGAARTIRPTEDVDCVVQIAKRSDYTALEKKLRELGFKHFVGNNAPMCRWIYNGVKVDIMPNDPKILGFANRWYDEGLKNKVQIILPDGQKISILTLPLFIATKIEAFHGRNERDFRISHDIEDIITVLDGQLDFKKFDEAPQAVKEYLKAQFKEFLADSVFIESISGHMEFGYQNKGRVKRIIDFLGNR
ncbi:MAG: nucleotidyl transferase AbiEii/AbiGii toxin family protein [Victivallales bacterium]